MVATARASSEMSAPVTCTSGHAKAASTAKLPLPVHRSITRVVWSLSQASMVPSASTSAIRLRGTMARSSM